MNKKDIVEIVNRKQKLKKENATKPLRIELEEVRSERAEVQKTILNKYRDMAVKELRENGFIIRNDDISLSNLSWSLGTKEEKAIEDKIDKLREDIDKETQDFIDKILIFGLKDDNVKEMVIEFLGMEV